MALDGVLRVHAAIEDVVEEIDGAREPAEDHERGKRRHELTLLNDGAAGHRPILQEYSPYLLDQMISVVTAATLVAYSVYTISSETAGRLGSDRLGLTIPFVLYGIFRYLYLVHQRNEGGSPSELLLTDRPLLVCVALWVLAVVIVIYVI